MTRTGRPVTGTKFMTEFQKMKYTIWRLNIKLKEDYFDQYFVLFCVHECPRPSSNVRCLTVINLRWKYCAWCRLYDCSTWWCCRCWILCYLCQRCRMNPRVSECRQFSLELSCSWRSYVLVLPSHFLQLQLLYRGGVGVLGCSCGVRSCCTIPMWVGCCGIMNYTILNLEFQLVELLLSSIIAEIFNLIWYYISEVLLFSCYDNTVWRWLFALVEIVASVHGLRALGICFVECICFLMSYTVAVTFPSQWFLLLR